MKALFTAIATLALLAAGPLAAQERSESRSEVRIVRTADGEVKVEHSGDGTVEVESDGEVVRIRRVIGDGAEKRVEEMRRQIEEMRREFEREIGPDFERIQEMLRRVREGRAEWPRREMPDANDFMRRIREQMEEMRNRHEEIFERMRRQAGQVERSQDGEVEKYEYTSPDGNTQVRIRIMRRVETPEQPAPEQPKPGPDQPPESGAQEF